MRHLLIASLLITVALTLPALAAASPVDAQAPRGFGACTGPCLAALAAATTGAPPSPPRASFDLIAEYTFDVAGSPASAWTLGSDGRAGKRLSFPLGRGSIKTYKDPLAVKAAVTNRRPMVWLNRNSEDAPYTYTLVLIGNPDLPLGLQMARAAGLGEIFPNLPTAEQMQAAEATGFCPRDLGAGESRVPVAALATGSARDATLRGELVTRDGVYLPLAISHIDFQPDAKTAQRCYQAPAFVLLAPSYPGWEDYQLHMVLADNIAGPPGEGWSILCAEWKSSNWWLRFLHTLYGC